MRDAITLTYPVTVNKMARAFSNKLALIDINPVIVNLPFFNLNLAKRRNLEVKNKKIEVHNKIGCWLCFCGLSWNQDKEIF